jgi:hypothetical protein
MGMLPSEMPAIAMKLLKQPQDDLFWTSAHSYSSGIVD